MKVKTYKVTASQLVYYTKIIEAENEEQAEEIAWEGDDGQNWAEFDYGEWQLEDIEKVKQPKKAKGESK